MKYLIFFLFTTTLYLNASDFSIDKIVKKIDSVQKTVQKSPTLDYKVYDPFATAKPILKQKSKTVKIVKNIKAKPILIQTIFNHKVLINGHWYRVGDKVYGATIVTIAKKNIILLKNNVKRTIYMRNKKKIIQTKEII